MEGQGQSSEVISPPEEINRMNDLGAYTQFTVIGDVFQEGNILTMVLTMRGHFHSLGME